MGRAGFCQEPRQLRVVDAEGGLGGGVHCLRGSPRHVLCRRVGAVRGQPLLRRVGVYRFWGAIGEARGGHTLAKLTVCVLNVEALACVLYVYARRGVPVLA